MAGLRISQEVLHSPQYAALQQHVSGSEPDLTKTLDAFCKPIEDKYLATSEPSDVEELLWVAWQTVVALAASTPHPSPSRETLAKFLVQLAYRPNLEKDGKPCEINGMVVWRDLPVFGYQLREAWNSAASDESKQELQAQWLNVNAFTATLVSSVHSSAVDRPDHSLFAVWTIRLGLEAQEQPSDIAVATAAMWFMHASPALWDFSSQSKTFDGRLARPGPLFKDQDWTGFSVSRWKAWGQTLDQLKSKLSNEDTAKLVQQALDAMSAASSG